MVHICIVSDTIHSYFGSEIETGTGGAERQQKSIATALKDRGHQVSIATLEVNGSSRSNFEAINIHEVIPDRRGIINAPYKALKTIRGISQIDADVYYVRGNDFLSMVTAAYTRFQDDSFVFGVANDENVDPELLSKRGLRRIPYMQAIRSADRIVAQTNRQQRLLATVYNLHSTLIPNGVNLPPKSDIVPFDDRKYVLWVGAVDPIQKNPKRFLELAQRIPNVQFRMIGPPDNDNPNYFDVIKTEAQEIDNLEFLGFVDPDKIHEHYQRAIAVVNTSDYEGFPNVFLESWVYATPVISLYFTFDEEFKDNSIGIHAGSMDNLEKTIKQLVSNEACRRDIGMNGRQHVEKNYSLEQMVDQYEHLFESL